jgi:DNA-binding response OmpR family regulator
MAANGCYMLVTATSYARLGWQSGCLLLRRRSNGTAFSLILFGPPKRRPRHTPPDSVADGFIATKEIDDVPARIVALVEQSAQRQERPVDYFRGRHLDAHFDRVEILVDGHSVDLTRRELALLRFLVSHPNRIVTRPDILAHVWRNENDGRSRTVDIHVRRLRMKLGVAGKQIQTVPGVGYRFSEK